MFAHISLRTSNTKNKLFAHTVRAESSMSTRRVRGFSGVYISEGCMAFQEYIFLKISEIFKRHTFLKKNTHTRHMIMDNSASSVCSDCADVMLIYLLAVRCFLTERLTIYAVPELVKHKKESPVSLEFKALGYFNT